MQPNPLINPYNQTVAVLMQGLLAEQSTGAALPAQRLSFLRSTVPNTARPERALAHYVDAKRSTVDVPVVVSVPYNRLDIQRYAQLYPEHLRYVPWSSSDPITLVEVLAYIAAHLGMLLDVDDVLLTRTDPTPIDVIDEVLITPIPTHPLWYGQLRLWLVPSTDLRSLITRRTYVALDVTELPD
jgi:hypothetical protein